MKRFLRYFLVFAAFFYTLGAIAQDQPALRGQHKAKKKETIFGIARMYDLSLEELLQANPEMKQPGYELKKGTIVNIPFPGAVRQEEAQPAPVVASEAPRQYSRPDDVQKRAIRVGVMLPLHNVNGDGRRMVEYYRGILMACDSLKQMGISIDIRAWNTAEDADISKVLEDKAAAECDIIFGPLYSKQMPALSDFVTAHDIRLVIPFSINAPQLQTNRNIFQIWQSPSAVNEATIASYMEDFRSCHPVFIDCNDSTSRKGIFTTGLRQQLDARRIAYSLTNLKSSEEAFSKAFDRKKRNIVILNTGRSPELGVAFAKINGLKLNEPTLDIAMFGYTEWLMYTRPHLDNFFKYSTYIPSVFYYNPLTTLTERLEQNYRWNFRADMQQSLPRFALTGFDHAFFFLRGLHKYGKNFSGAAGMFGYAPVQTPLAFKRVGDGGQQNHSLLFVHYTPEHRIDVIRKK